jgi:hypothetical protein
MYIHSNTTNTSIGIVYLYCVHDAKGKWEMGIGGLRPGRLMSDISDAAADDDIDE